ncbi:(2Fe-2S)-binding protein [Streptomyces sp. NPDC049585]|uniref:(2Fe-2S)-binding protein n=1 Tax=Streptomyces sp. NPDC049585 TaxID=3155154 RepID=UPI00343A5ECF
MSDEQQHHTAAPGAGTWQPIPQGAGLDAEGTTFVQLPPELLAHPGPDATGSWDPLTAPGTGYTPPPADTGHWQTAYEPAAAPVAPAPAVPAAPAAEGLDDTQQWAMPFATGDEPAHVHDAHGAGEWTVPAAGDDSVEESGEYALRDAAGPRTPAHDADTVTGAGDHGLQEWTPDPVGSTAVDVAERVAEPAEEPVEEPVAPAATAEGDAAAADHAEAPAEPVDATDYAATDYVADYTATDYTATDYAAADYAEPEPAAEAHPHNEHPCASYVLRVNGTDRPVTGAWIGESLLYVLRERLGLAGAKDGCSQGECGACSVQVDGRLVASCLVPAATTAGSEVRTVEGLAEHGRPSDVQRALIDCGAVQCGFCVPGMAMTVHDLLEGNHAPSDLETRQALCGNLCRCSGYQGVLAAVRQVAEERAEAAAALAEAQEQQEGGQGDGTARIPHQAAPYGDDGTGSGFGKATA